MKKLFIILAAIAMVGAFAATTMAADWAFYGSARMGTYYESFSKEVTGTGSSESQTLWDMQSNSRIGGRVAAGEVTGGFEYGHNGDPVNNVGLRLLYARWNFSESGYLLLGQAYTPVAYWVGAQAYGPDNGLIGNGAPYGDREAQIKVVAGGFQFAALRNSGAYGYDTMLPKLELRYDLAFGDHSVGAFGGYQSYDAAGEDVSSLMYGLGYTGAFGPVWLNANAHGGTNMAEANWGGTYIPYHTPGGKDTQTVAVALALGMAASETMKFEGGFGYTADTNDDVGPDTDTTMAVYVNGTFTIAPGFMIVPEIGYYDFMKDMNDNDQGNAMYAGAKWQMNF